MTTHPIGPIVLDSIGDHHWPACAIASLLWVGTTTAGDRVAIHECSTGALLWKGLASGTNTYIGVTFGQGGLAAPGGFVCTTIDSGELLVYLKEPGPV